MLACVHYCFVFSTSSVERPNPLAVFAMYISVSYFEASELVPLMSYEASARTLGVLDVDGWIIAVLLTHQPIRIAFGVYPSRSLPCACFRYSLRNSGTHWKNIGWMPPLQDARTPSAAVALPVPKPPQKPHQEPQQEPQQQTSLYCRPINRQGKCRSAPVLPL